MSNNRQRQGQRQSRSSRWVLWSIIVTLVVFTVWAGYSKLEQITRATGQVVASSRTQIIQSLDGGLIDVMAVKEGEAVKAGQLLVRFSKERAAAAYEETRAKTAALQSTVDRLQAEILDQPLHFDPMLRAYPSFVTTQTALYAKRRQALNDEVKGYTRALALAKQELATSEPLLEKGDVGLAEVLRLRRQVTDLETQIINRRNKYFQDTQTEHAKAQEELASVRQVMAQRKLQLDNCEIRAPMSAVVKNIRFTTVGAVVRAGEDILELVPADGDLVVEVKVRPADVGFIRPGLPVTIKFDAYDYSIYGGLDGEVIYISADTLKEETNRPTQDSTYYLVRVRAAQPELKSKSGQSMAVIPGMTVTAEIITGKRTILQYLLKPVIKTLNESMTER